ncbi:hypothetical protein [Streptomyces sp. NPDC059819]|uniref:hypothetical protein n=1 Tax=Streptomyces sp. NPDC059819 TaxID=3346963 RepID=UPI0036534665
MARLKVEISVPLDCADKVIEALHQAGAGRIGRYDRCASMWQATGTWQPLPGARPYDGEVGIVQYAQECRIESVCDESGAQAVQQAVLAVHPYEEAVVHFLPLYEP